MPRSYPDYTGERIGHLTCIGKGEVSNNGKGRKWRWLCDCGNVRVAERYSVLRSKNPTCLSCSHRKHEKVTDEAVRRDWYRIRRRHKDKGFPIETCISLEQFEKVARSNCVYCGAEPTRTVKHKASYSVDVMLNGLDRIDSSRGYEPENVVPCCMPCNMAKGTYTYTEFMEHIKQIYDHNHLGDKET